MAWWQQLLVSLAGGAFAALFAMVLSLRRFSRERWWEKRLMIYTAIIEALQDRRRFFEIELEEFEGGQPYAPAYKKNAAAASADALHRLRNLAATAELILQPSAISLLEEFLRFEDSPNTAINLHDVFEASCIRTGDALAQIREHARADLGLRGSARM